MGPYADVLAALQRADVACVVVGGVAVVLSGVSRLTVDLDLVIDLEPLAARRAVTALRDLGLVPRLPVDPEQFADEDVRRGWVEQRNLLVFSFFDPENPLREVDLFATHPLPFDELLGDARTVTVDGVPARVASVAHLIALKQLAGRPRDLADIEALSALERDQ